MEFLEDQNQRSYLIVHKKEVRKETTYIHQRKKKTTLKIFYTKTAMQLLSFSIDIASFLVHM